MTWFGRAKTVDLADVGHQLFTACQDTGQLIDQSWLGRHTGFRVKVWHYPLDSRHRDMLPHDLGLESYRCECRGRVNVERWTISSGPSP